MTSLSTTNNEKGRIDMSKPRLPEETIVGATLSNETVDFKLAYILTLEHVKAVPSLLPAPHYDYFAFVLKQNYEGIKKLRAEEKDSAKEE